MIELKKYPLVDTKELFDDGGWQVPFHYAIHIAAKGFSKPPEERISKFDKALHAGLDWIEEQYFQRALTGFNKTFPKLSAYRGFFNNPTNLETMYTVVHKGHELPIYLRDSNDPRPTDSMLADNIKVVRDTDVSPYDQRAKVENFYDSEFGAVAAPKFTRGDIENEKLFPEPLRFRGWFIKDDMWRMQQYGEMKERKVSAEGGDFTVREYSLPDKWNSFWYWAIGDKIYDIIDAPFDTIQEQLIAKSPPAFRQYLTKEEYKMIAGIRRSLFNPRTSTPLTFDLTELRGYRTQEAETIDITPASQAA
ncbi:MAG: hypothetical protein ABIJ92_02150 [Candidatus Aenigmatarchaeota archaeon]